MSEGSSQTGGQMTALAAIGSAVAWWPGFADGRHSLPLQACLAAAGLCVGLSTLLALKYCLWLASAAGAGAFAGLWLTAMIWPNPDPIGAAYGLIFIPALSLAVMVAAPLAGLAMRGRSVSDERVRRMIGIAIYALVTFGPAALLVKRVFR